LSNFLQIDALDGSALYLELRMSPLLAKRVMPVGFGVWGFVGCYESVIVAEVTA